MKRTYPLKGFVTGLCLAAVALLTGCFETTEEYTLNPDGSGKVVHECSFQQINLNNQNDSSEDALKEAVSKVIEDSKGVDAWRDVTYKRLDDGRFYFKGTAYFKHLSQLDIKNQTMLAFDWNKLGDGKALLTLRTNKGDGTKVEKKPDDWSKLSAEERAKKLREERGKYQQMKPMLIAFISTMKHDVVLHLPGKLSESSNFSKDPSGALKLQFDGAKLLAAMDKLVNDDAWIAKNGGSFEGNDKPMMDEEVNATVFGSKAPVRAVIAGTTPLFNYTNELAAAQKDFAQVRKQLGLGTQATAVAPLARGQPLKSLKVAGVRLVTQTDKKNGSFRPFNWETGYTLSLLVEFPGSILGFTDECKFDTAIADDGSDLSPERDWDREIHSPQVSDDKTSVLFEVKLKLPGPNVKGIKELSGKLQYTVASGAKQLDLGFDELKPKSKGTELGAEIESIEEGWKKDGSQRLQLKVKARRETIRSMSLVLDGVKTELKENGYGGGGNKWSITYESKTAIPAKARLVAEVYDQIQTFDVPFKLENVSLIGSPLK